MGCNTPQAAEENFPTVPTEYTKLHLHRAVIHAPFPKAPRTQSLSLRLPRRSKGKSEGSQAGGHRAESSPEPGTRTLPITGSDTALLCRGAPPPWVHAADRETAMHGMHESPVVPTDFFLASAFIRSGFCWWHLAVSRGAGQSCPTAAESIARSRGCCPHPSPDAGTSPGRLTMLSTPSHRSLTTLSKSFSIPRGA